VSSAGSVKVIDFGIAKSHNRRQGETGTGVVKGKVQYMAPEQALGHKVDRRADIWAVGAILYTLLAGKPPFEGENPLATLNLLASGRPPMPLPSAVHPAITAIVRRALSFPIDQRYATAADLRDAIERGMVAAQCTTTTADVAAFAAEHLADRMEKRRHAVEAAVDAAEERERANPPEEQRRPSSIAPRIVTGSPPWPPPSSGMLPSPLPLAAQTRADAPAGRLPSLEALARLSARASEPPPQASSYATLGSAALDTSIQTSKSRKGIFVLLGTVILATIVAVGVSLNVLRPGPAVSATSPPPESVPSTLSTTSAGPGAPSVASPSVPAPSTSAGRSSVPTVDASSLPRAVPPPQFPPPAMRHPVWTGGPRPHRYPGGYQEEPNPTEPTPLEAPPQPAPTPPPPQASPPRPPPAPGPKPAGTVDDGF
jgi:serine/threonine protein kinase